MFWPVIILFFLVLIEAFFIALLMLAFGAHERKIAELELRALGFRRATMEAFTLADFNFTAHQKTFAALFSALGIKASQPENNQNISDKFKN